MIRDLLPTLKSYDSLTGLNLRTKNSVRVKGALYDIVDKVFEICGQIEADMEEAEALRVSYKETSDKGQEDSILMDLTNKNSKINLQFNQANNEVQRIRDDVNEELKGDPECNDPILRMKNLISKILQAKVFNLIKLSQKNQLEVKVTIKEKIGRQLRVLDPSITNDQVELLIADPDKVQAVVKEKMYASSHAKIQSAISGIKEKLKEIIELEKNVVYLHSMIQDLALIIRAQSEVIDSIEANMKAVRDFIDSGIKAFEKAKEDYMKAQEKFCMILIICIIIGIIGVWYGMSQVNLI